jgi:pimeloyl-ACP methyl ester carboxylesterase
MLMEEPMPSDLWIDVRGEGKPIVLMHSALTDSRSWEPLVDRMEDYRMIRFDARGFGRSAAAREKYDLLSDLLQVLHGAGLREAHVVGNSMGADVAIAAAVFHPEVVTSLTLIGPGMDLERPPEESGRWMGQFRSARAGRDVEPAIAAIRALWLSADDQLQRARETVADPRTYEAISLATMPEFDRTDIARIQASTLIMVGDRDDRTILESAELLASTIPGARLVHVRGAHHHPQEDEPAEVAQILREFVGAAGREQGVP